MARRETARSLLGKTRSPCGNSPLNTKNLHTVCVVGAANDFVERVDTLLDELARHLDARWQRAEQASADLLLIDPDSVYGHMDWLRAQASGTRPIVACTNAPEAYAADLHLRKPIVAAELVAILNRVGRHLAAEPKRPPAAPAAAAASAVTPAAATPIPAPRVDTPAPAAPPPAAPRLLDLLGTNPPGALSGRVCLEAAGLPTLYLDPQTQSWHSTSNLKGLSGWCRRELARADVQVVGDADFTAAVASLPAQPYARLTWLAHLQHGEGQLEPDLDPNARYKLARWPQSEREFPKHFRIATVMLKQAASIGDIADQSGASVADVADFINAYHALGFVEHDAPARGVDDARRGGLFGRGKKNP